MRGEIPGAQVYKPRHLNGKPAREVAIIREQPLPDIRKEIVRIQTEADPIGFLNAVLNGMAFETHLVLEDGTIKTFYEYPDLPTRIKVARYLTDKILPRLAVVKHIDRPSDPEGGGSPASAGQGTNGMTWAQLVSKAGQDTDE